MKLIHEGTKVICPNDECKKIIAVAMEDIYFSQKPFEDLLEYASGDPGDSFKCRYCKTDYVRLNGEYKLHTEFGWV